MRAQPIKHGDKGEQKKILALERNTASNCKKGAGSQEMGQCRPDEDGDTRSCAAGGKVQLPAGTNTASPIFQNLSHCVWMFLSSI